ncbi:cytidine deaminase [Mucilaginibacter terrae]|uniref:Cytidine deaminase n=1 Tax=Mucilaginibacter terrae TaxID=1955052 RepID=A0ABU3GV15_9SPHI|nr:cytidine deaminase [Mucilaginibacter terrae]MDT3402787.1 cytidine deaminase [Mucilaginibacter terrae]
MISHEIKIAFEEYHTFEELNDTDKALCLEAEKALAGSHSPYSNFSVGAALRLKSGRIIYGSNQENAAYPSGLCAERVALFTWGANFANDPIEAMAVTAHTDKFTINKPITPCGSCLQVLAEYEKKQAASIRTLLYCRNGAVWATQGADSFLPFMFFEDRLAAVPV